MSRFNPALAALAFEGLGHLTKQAFVPMGPNADIAAQQQQQAQAQQQQAPGGQPAQPGAQPPPQPNPSQGQAPPQPDPSQQQQAPPQPDPSQQQPQQAQQPQPGTNPDDMRAMMKEELAAANEKPQKLPIQDRVNQLEGLVLRLMEYQGMVKPDPNLTTQAPASSGDSGGVVGNAMPQVPTVPGQPSGMAKAAGHREFNRYLHGLLKEAGYVLNLGVNDVVESLTNELLGRVNPEVVTGMGKVAALKSHSTPLPADHPLAVKTASAVNRSGLAKYAATLRGVR